MTRTTGHLKCRIESHARFARFEINDWIFSFIQPRLGEEVFDLGCGTGKQTIPLAQIVGQGSRVVALDLSQDALSEIVQVAKDKQLINIETINASMDQSLEILGGQGLDLIISCFAIYYASHPVELIQRLHHLLVSTGRIFLCGNGQDNNKELIHLLNQVAPDGQKFQPMQPFLSDEQLTIALTPYSSYMVRTFENPLAFPDVKSVMEYWESCSLYRPELRASVEQILSDHFQKNSAFTTIKRVRGILAYA